MLDLQFVRSNPQLVAEKSKQKGVTVDIEVLIKLDTERKKLLSQVEEIRQQRNTLAHANTNHMPSDDQVKKGKQLKENLAKLERSLKQTDAQLEATLKLIPNMPTDDVPIGQSEADNRVVKTWGDKPNFAFTAKSHYQIGEAKGWIDKERAAKVAAARFVYLKGDLVLLEYALWQFGLSVLTNQQILKEIAEASGLSVSSKPFLPVLPPAVAKKAVFEATGRLNKEEQTYKLEDEDLWLNASAEHTLAPMYLNEILEETELPIRLVGHTTAFRREAGTYGKDTEGILRLHQFNKLEMESFSLPEDSMNEHLFLVAIEEYLMQALGLPYQLLQKCTADIGFPNARGMDIEAWLPGQNKYRETHTSDLITDFQARSMKTRVRRSNGVVELVHTNDATAFSERPLIAIIENYQTKEGNVAVPEVLQKFLGKAEI